MTVYELLQALRQMPAEAEVAVYGEGELVTVIEEDETVFLLDEDYEAY